MLTPFAHRLQSAFSRFFRTSGQNRPRSAEGGGRKGCSLNATISSDLFSDDPRRVVNPERLKTALTFSPRPYFVFL